MSKPTSRFNLQTIVGLIVSALLVAFLLSQFDLESVNDHAIAINFLDILLVFGIILFQFWVISYRWSCINQIRLGISFKSSVLAYGANMVLPARGGDVLRLAYLKRTRHSGTMSGIVSLAIEKTGDLVAMLLVLSLWFIVYKGDLVGLMVMPGIVGIVLLALLYLILFQRTRLLTVLQSRQHSRAIKKLSDKLAKGLSAIDLDYRLSDYVKIILSTGFIWAAAYPVFYIVVFKMLGQSITMSDIYLIMAVTGLGLALPSAPSGIGVFHAAVVSTMVFLGHQYDDALIAATLLHLFLTIPVVVYALILYLVMILSGNLGRDEIPPSN